MGPAGAAAVEHQLADRVALDEHRVERVAHRRERVAERDHRRMHAHRDLAVELFGDREQLDDVAEVARRRDVVERDVRDALAVDVTGRRRAPNAIDAMIAALAAASKPLDVGGRVGLGEAEALCLVERVGERGTGVGHAGEDVVGGAVHDAHHPPDAVAGQRFAQRPDQRDPTAHRCLEEDVDARALGGLEQLATVGRDQLLVGGDDRLAAHQRFDDEGAGRLDAADHLDDDVDFGIAHHLSSALSVKQRAGSGSPRSLLMSRTATRVTSSGTPARLDDVGVVVDEAHERAPHVAATQHTDPYAVVHLSLLLPRSHRATRSSNVSRRTTTRAWPSRTNTTAGRGNRL